MMWGNATQVMQWPEERKLFSLSALFHHCCFQCQQINSMKCSLFLAPKANTIIIWVKNIFIPHTINLLCASCMFSVHFAFDCSTAKTPVSCAMASNKAKLAWWYETSSLWWSWLEPATRTLFPCMSDLLNLQSMQGRGGSVAALHDDGMMLVTWHPHSWSQVAMCRARNRR
jgi:hypothetical protein